MRLATRIQPVGLVRERHREVNNRACDVIRGGRVKVHLMRTRV